MENSRFSSCDFEPKKRKPHRAFQKNSDLRASNWSLKDFAGCFFGVFVGAEFCWSKGLSTRRSSDWAEVCPETNLQARCDWQMKKSPKLTEASMVWSGRRLNVVRSTLLQKRCVFFFFGEKMWIQIFWYGQKVPWGGCLLWFFLKVVFSWKDHHWIYIGSINPPKKLRHRYWNHLEVWESYV